jgi:hypothetical protein
MKRVITAMAAALLLATVPMRAQASAMSFTLVLTANAVGAGCYNVLIETINGQPFALNGEGYLSPNSAECGANDGGLGVILPPQPFLPNYSIEWFTMSVPRSQVQRGAFVQNKDANGNPIPNSFSTTDTFYYNDESNPQTIGNWTGSVVGQWKSHQQCYRGRCYTAYVAQSYVATMTQTQTAATVNLRPAAAQAAVLHDGDGW